MTAAFDMLPGLQRVRDRFIALLKDRQLLIARHTLAAWDGVTAQEVNENLHAVQHILHQIAGSAGSIGLAELGEQAQECEMLINSHLESAHVDKPRCPEHVAAALGQFVAECQVLTDAAAA